MPRTCSVCGRRAARGAGVCATCGEPFAASETVSRKLATTAGRSDIAGVAVAGLGSEQPADGSVGDVSDGSAAPRSSQSPRWLVVASALIVCLALSATYAALRAAPQRIPDGNADGQVQLSSEPKVRWQLPLTAIAPDLDCPAAPVSSTSPQDPGGLMAADTCAVTSSATAGDVVVLAVERSQRVELVGLARSTGAVMWHRATPAGATYDCMVTRGATVVSEHAAVPPGGPEDAAPRRAQQ